ncbi:hypothetical protein JR316_0013401 [Psilocybe cubensis]|uniref:Uncharacterized protein n=2 Tax=Psilocybe cubensis TaxID=181762 RepID=A0ACB8GFB3_PSICU|nr:uncharacterized protein JR316_0013401 [Psilocybe cubensis]KAH9474238.1 hypothetical protein JR316_0013401 [Psilocybe cubensis]
MSTFNVNIAHVNTSQSVPVSTPRLPQSAGNSSGAGATTYVVAPQATSSSKYDPQPWTDILSLVGPTPRDILEIYYAKFSSHTVDVGKAAPSEESTNLIRSPVDVLLGFPQSGSGDVSQRHDNFHRTTSGSVAKESESIVDRLVVVSLATGTVDPAVLIRTSRRSREKRSQGVMRSQAASDRHHPYNVANRPSRIAVPRNSGNEDANTFCRPSGETENTQFRTSQHREQHHRHGSGNDIPVEQMPLTAPNPNEDGRDSEMRGSTGDGDSGETEQPPRKMQGHRSDRDPCFRTREEICSQGKAGVGKRKRQKR